MTSLSNVRSLHSSFSWISENKPSFFKLEYEPSLTMLPSLIKTIKAPYSQGNVAVFGLNAGQQCVPMSLCCLIYKNNKVINSCDDLVQIMDIGNQIYSILSQSTGQSFLMLKELPSILNVFESEYELVKAIQALCIKRLQ